MPVIGYLSVGSPESDDFRLTVFRQGLKDTGFLEGQNVAIEYRWAQGQNDRLPALAADVVRRQVTVIATVGPPPVFAAKTATSTIPIVFVSALTRFKLVSSPASPGREATSPASPSSQQIWRQNGLSCYTNWCRPRPSSLCWSIPLTLFPTPWRETWRMPLVLSGCSLVSCERVARARSRQLSGPWWSSEPVRSFSMVIRSSPTNALKLSLWLPATRCPRSMGFACFLPLAA